MIPEWILQTFVNMIFSGIVAGIIVSMVKARMEHYYQKKGDQEKKSDELKLKQERSEKEATDREILWIRNEISGLKKGQLQLSDKLTLVKENVLVVISKQESMSDRISEVNEMVKTVVQQNFGRVIKR